MSLKSKIVAGILMLLLVVCAWQYSKIGSLMDDCSRYKSNSEALLEGIERYKISDSINAAKVGVLTLKLSEVEKLRAEDVKTIELLKVKKNELEQLTTMQLTTIANIKGEVKDSIVYRDRIIRDTIKTLDVSDEWIDLHGVIYDDGAFDGTLEVRDSITIVETVQRARFLGFLWRTKRVKSRELDVVNKNPYSQIVGVNSIRIEE